MQLSDLLSLALFAGAATAAPPCDHDKPHEGFVTTSGTEFRLDGDRFLFAGSNAYYFPFDNVCNSFLP